MEHNWCWWGLEHAATTNILDRREDCPAVFLLLLGHVAFALQGLQRLSSIGRHNVYEGT